MRWALPLGGLVALGIAAPLIAHLLSRRPPVPRPFPSLRFLYTTPTAARRLRTLHDPWLWALRTLIVLVIAGAAAGPTLVTARRLATWQPPVLRAIVVAPGQDTHTVEESGPRDDTHWSYANRPVRESLAAALRDLGAHGDRPREVVIRWDGRRRGLSDTDIDAIPASIGVRLEVAAAPGPDAAAGAGTIEVAAAPGDEAARAFVLSTVSWPGGGGIRVVWPGATTRAETESRASPPSRPSRALFGRMRLDPRLAEAAQRSRPDAGLTATADDDRLPRALFEPLARSAAGQVLLWGAEAQGRPLLVLDARVRDPLALWSLRVAADARRSADGWPQADTQWSETELQAAQRPPAPDTATPLPGGLDTRWWWLAALVLVLLEGVVRRRLAPVPGSAASADGARDAA